jgi:hypothetical protein
MLSPRVLLLALVVVASAAFVVGVALERSNETDHRETSAASTTQHEQAEGGESPTEHGSESTGAATHASVDADAGELRPLGVDVEAWPFVIAAVVASLAFALAGWLRPGQTGLLTLVAVAMLAFGAFDAREVAHQIDIDKSGLAVLAAVVALLHLAAAAFAASIALGSHHRRGGLGDRAGTMAA